MNRYKGLVILLFFQLNAIASDKPAHLEALKLPRKAAEIQKLFEKSNIETFVIRDGKGQVPEIIMLENSALSRVMNHKNGTPENGTCFKLEFKGIRLTKLKDSGNQSPRVEMRIMGKAKETIGSTEISAADLESGKQIKIHFPRYEKNKLGTLVVIEGDMNFRWDEAKQQLQIQHVGGNLDIDSRIFGQQSCPGELTNVLGVRGKLDPLPLLD